MHFQVIDSHAGALNVYLWVWCLFALARVAMWFRIGQKAVPPLGSHALAMTESLFRKEALDAKRGSWLGSICLAQPLSFWVLTAFATAAAAAIGLFLCSKTNSSVSCRSTSRKRSR